MENREYLCNLYDYYKDLLTENQRNFFFDYYFDNLTQEEIAYNQQISKNAISKTIKETINKLENYEESLHLLKNRESIAKILDEETFKKIISFI